MPKKTRTTTDPIGAKLLLVLREQGHADDLNYLAEQFGVKVQSTYDWIQHGRISKDRYARLVSWSQKPLEWWFDVAPIAYQTLPSMPLVAREEPFGWPFKNIGPTEWTQLSPLQKAEIEGFARGLLMTSTANREAA